jgi:beta-galactosidase
MVATSGLSGRCAEVTANDGHGDRQVVSLDRGWRFAFGDAADMTRDFGFGGEMSYAKITNFPGAVTPKFVDDGWRKLDLPHDWVVETPFVQEPKSEELTFHGYKPVGRAFPATSIGWYRKHLTIPAGDAGKRFWIEFDGVFRDATVWLNGVLLGRHEGGYAPFGFDATDAITIGGDNVLVVRVDATHAEGWFYEGAGIYRHVWLVKTAPVHIGRFGTFVAPTVGEAKADLDIRTAIVNEADTPALTDVTWQVLGPDGAVVATKTATATTIAGWGKTEMAGSIPVTSPVLWSLEKPALYTLVSTVRTGGRTVDETRTKFGIRTIRFDPDKGFFLNGKHVQINGMCNHQDHAGVGAAVPDRLQRYRIERLKEMGVNAYRSSHNPPTPELLDACDELGMLVMDETRLFSSSELSLGHLETLVRRDRNHPSVFLWSIGNEEPEQASALGHRVAATMKRTVLALDSTRPVTYASNSGAYEGVNELMDVRGFNYHLGDVDKYRLEHPTQPIFLSEVASTLTTRGEYADDKVRGYMSAYDRFAPPWGELAHDWLHFMAERPYIAGGFVWTGFDYRGEPTPYEWPCISSHFGILDTTGAPKDLFWYYKSWWTNEPVLHLLPHWNWAGKEGTPIDVWAFTNFDAVRLLVNGRDMGLKHIERLGRAEWSVPYAPGTLVAIGYKNGKEAARETVATTGAAAGLVLAADRPAITPAQGDVSIINVSAIDAQRRAVPTASNSVAFEVSGPGRILGVGNGDPSSHESDTPTVPTTIQRKLFNGHAQIIIAPTGEAGDITLTVKAEGLDPATVTVKVGRGN